MMVKAAIPALAAAYPAYLPLRNYIAAGKAMAPDLAAALVFTVEKYEDPLAAIAATIAATAPLAPPVIEGLVRCAPGVVSPCDDGKTGAAHVRGCLAADSASANFDTYQGTMALPVFQKGTPPYLTPADGGNIDYDATSGLAIILLRAHRAQGRGASLRVAVGGLRPRDRRFLPFHRRAWLVR